MHEPLPLCHGGITLIQQGPRRPLDVLVQVLDAESQVVDVALSLRSIKRPGQMCWQPGDAAVRDEVLRRSAVVGINLQSLVAVIQQPVNQPLHVTRGDVEPMAPDGMRSSQHQTPR